jgi:hypothetical protein
MTDRSQAAQGSTQDHRQENAASDAPEHDNEAAVNEMNFRMSEWEEKFAPRSQSILVVYLRAGIYRARKR